ncbi:tautomerase family protein [Zoogloea sp.]|jgi:4-oxalocrotonate tautomerase|uniref:tautomerase family protein n=1 Tax=Zoogloea sp. TaxID=49181 RepID=UPI002616B02A|nr:tautomerase family protein [Zoogloea sp.]
MPNLNVYLVEGFAPERKTALLKRMTDAVVATIGAPREAVRIFLIELARAHVCVGGVTLEEADLPGGPTVHALLVAGRSEAQKEALIGGLTRAIEETLDVPADPVRIMILDIANTDFGMKGVTARSLGR